MRCLPELMPERAHRRGQAQVARQAHGDAHVLEHQLELERVVETAGEHALADVRSRDPRAARRFVEHVGHRRRVEAGTAADRQAFGRRRQRDCGDQVVQALHGVAGARAAQMKDAMAHPVKQRPHPLEIRVGRAHHEHEFGGDGAVLGARHRRVDHGDALFCEPAGRVACDPGFARRGVEQQRAAAHARGGAVVAITFAVAVAVAVAVAEQDPRHHTAVRQHGDKDVAVARHLAGRRAGPLRSTASQRAALLCRQ